MNNEISNISNNNDNSKLVMLFSYFTLILRIILFLLGALFFVTRVFNINFAFFKSELNYQIFLYVCFFLLLGYMIIRLFPVPFESPGCQKHFKSKYIKTGSTKIHIQDNHAVLLVGLLWICLNAFFGILKFNNIVTDDFMILLALAYAVCDYICILFFCPFQTFFLKNHCCVQCRIYNWNYIMICTPLFFVVDYRSIILIVLALIILFKWELTIFYHPERFSLNTNEYLSCKHCNEQLCRHKKQLNSLWKQISKYNSERLKKLTKNDK